MPISPEKLQNLQKRLDEKLINPKDLNVKQKIALDRALKSGQLKGYEGGVAEMMAERNIARKTVAKDIRAKLAPLTPASTFSLGIKRGTMVAAGDIIGSFAPYLMDSKKLATEARLAALAGKSVGYKPSLAAVSAKGAFQGVTNLLMKVPGLRNLKAFRNTAKVLDGFKSLIGKGGVKGAQASGLIASQALATELKSQMYGALGAGAGSIAYDSVNFPAKMAVAMGEDLSGIDQNQYAQMNPLARTAYHAMDNARTALLWNAGAFGLFGLGRGMWHQLGKTIKVDPVTQRKINEQILDQGVPMGITHYVEGTGGMSSLVKGINEITSVLPVAAGVPKMARAKFTASAMMALNANLKNATNVPLLHSEVLANAIKESTAKTYDEAGNVFGSLYKAQEEKLDGISDLFARYVDEIAARKGVIMGKPVGTTLPATGQEQILTNLGIKGGMDIPFISTENLRATTANIINDIRKTMPVGTEARMAQAGLRSGSMDPVNGFVKEINDRLAQYRALNHGDSYITPAQYNQMRRDWNDNYVRTFAKSADPVQAKVLQVLEAFEKDFSNVVKAPNQAAALASNAKLAKMYNGIKAELGPQKADEFFNAYRTQLAAANQDYIDANYMFGQVQNFYNNSKLAAIVRQMDSSELTAKQALNITGKNAVNNVQGMNKLFKAAFDPKWGTSEGVDELYNLLGGAKYFGKNPAVQKRAAYTMKLLMYRHFFDAFNQNAVVRKTGSTVVEMKPFTTEGADLATTIEMLNARSPHFRDTTEEILRKGMPSGDVSPALVNKIAAQKAAIDVDLIRKGIEDGIPLESRVLITQELQAAQKQADNIIFTRQRQGLPVKPRQEIINDLVKPIDLDVVGKRKILATGMEKGKVIDEATRQRLTKELDTLNMRLGAYEEFKFKNFQKALGLGTDSGRAQLIKGFELGQGMSKGAAKTHVDNLETIIAALERNAQAPIGDSSKFILRRVILSLGLGGTASFAIAGGPGLLAFAMAALMLRGGAHFFNSPAMAKKWLDLYTVAERLKINSIQNMLPTRQAVFADVFNYAFADDPDRPIVAPGNIPEEKIIRYLQEQETVQSVPTADGLYNTTPDETKMRFDPDLRKLRDLNKPQFVEVEGFNQGMRVANERSDLLDQAENSPQLQERLTPQARNFIENPQAEVPPGAAAGMNMAQGITPSAQTANMYQAMFPGDSIGAAIAQKRTQKPTLQIPNQPTYMT